MSEKVLDDTMQQELLKVLRHARLAFDERGESGVVFAGGRLSLEALRAHPDGVPVDDDYSWRELVMCLYGPVMRQLSRLSERVDPDSRHAITEMADQLRGLPEQMDYHDVPWEMERQLRVPVNVEGGRARPDRSVNAILGGLKWVRLEGDDRPYRYEPETSMPGGEE